MSQSGLCYICEHWEISRQVFQEHFCSFGFSCRFVDLFDELCTLDASATIAVIGLDEESEEIRMKITQVKSRFKIALCQLRSPNEIRTEPGIHAMVSRHIKRESLRNIVHQLLTSGSAFQPASRQAPYSPLCQSEHSRIENIGETHPLKVLMAEDNPIVALMKRDSSNCCRI